MSPCGDAQIRGSYEYATASIGPRACCRQNSIAASGSSHVENGTGDFPCLRREKRSSSAAATIFPSTTSAAAGSWKTALMPSTRLIGRGLFREALLMKQARHADDTLRSKAVSEASSRLRLSAGRDGFVEQWRLWGR